MTTNKRPTMATLKSFIKKNEGNLYILNQMDFDGMTDCVQSCGQKEFRKAGMTDKHTEHTLGISGVWVVGRSRDYITNYSDGIYTGFEVSNACGLFTIASKQS